MFVSTTCSLIMKYVEKTVPKQKVETCQNLFIQKAIKTICHAIHIIHIIHIMIDIRFTPLINPEIDDYITTITQTATDF